MGFGLVVTTLVVLLVGLVPAEPGVALSDPIRGRAAEMSVSPPPSAAAHSAPPGFAAPDGPGAPAAAIAVAPPTPAIPGRPPPPAVRDGPGAPAVGPAGAPPTPAIPGRPPPPAVRDGPGTPAAAAPTPATPRRPPPSAAPDGPGTPAAAIAVAPPTPAAPARPPPTPSGTTVVRPPAAGDGRTAGPTTDADSTAGDPTTGAAPSADGGYTWPLRPTPPVLTPFAAPDNPFGPGHRGVDLGGAIGQPVRAARGGTVIFAGLVAGQGVVSVQHDDGLRTTYEPVVPTVRAGARVATGDVLGTLATGHPGCPSPCLHWGVRRDRLEYLDPLVLLRPPHVRLLPVPEPWPDS